jgi:hypothetical protein
MLGNILDEKFSNLLNNIVQYIRVNEQIHFEECEANQHESYESHDFLKFIDLAIYMAETHIELDPEVAVRLMKLTKYASYIGCNYGNDLVVIERPEDYFSIKGMIVNYEEEQDNYHNYKFVLWKYEYQN